jgi:O-antigen ligase
LFVLAAYVLGRSFFGGDPGLRDFELLRIVATLLVAFLFASTVTGKGPRILFIGLLLISAFFQTLVEAYQFYCDASWMPVRKFLPELSYFNNSTVGTYVNKNHLAWLLCSSGLFALSIACWGRVRWLLRGGIFYAAAFSFFGVLISLSRGGILSLAAGIVVFAVVSIYLVISTANRRAAILGLYLAAGVTLSAVIILYMMMQNVVVYSRLQELWLDSFREDLWRAGIHDAGLAPFFGMGPASFQYAARLMMPQDSLLAHNDFLQFFSEYGLVGLLLLLAFLFTLLWSGFRVLLMTHVGRGGRKGLSSNTLAILIGSLSVAVAQIIHSFFDFNMHIAANAVLAGFFVGSLCNPGMQRSRGEIGRSRLGWLCCSMMAFLVLITGFLLLRDWTPEKEFFKASGVMCSLPLYPGQKELDAAVIGARSSARMEPDNPRYNSGLGSLLWFRARYAGSKERVLGDYEDAATALTTACRQDERNWFSALRLGGSLAALGNEVGARKAYLEAMQRMPQFVHPYLEFADALRVFGKNEEAAHYFRISSRFPDPEDVREQLKETEGDSAKDFQSLIP